MCGIVGVWRADGPLDAGRTRGLLEAAASAIAHRGPDASGVRILAGEGAGFAHRRLSILDLDPRADQPMASSDGKSLITFNGEIYNFRELREELRRDGGSFRTESDTEVLLEGCRLWGLDRLLPRLAGMFAFALYDSALGRLTLVRDRAGKKPLFYAEAGAAVSFASELAALLRLAPEARALDPAGLDAYLSLKFTPSPLTLLKGVRQLPPGWRADFQRGRPASLSRYWQPFVQPGPPPAGAGWLERLDAALLTANRRRLVSDVPVCVFLSGGVDSGLIASYLQRLGAVGRKAYCIGYEDLPGYNEFDYARATAGKFGLELEEVRLDSARTLATLSDDSLVLDEPISDWVWVPLLHLSRKAHADGFKVVLVGEGSDELFFGYDVMLKGLRLNRRFASPAWRAAARVGAAAMAPVFRRARRGHGRYDLLRRAAAGEPVYLGSSVGFRRSQRHHVAGPRLLAEGDPEAGVRFVRRLYEEYASLSPRPDDDVGMVCYLEFFSKMGEVLLKRLDRISMQCSLEARSPYLDHELVELAFSIPGEARLPGGRLKGLLKDLARRTLPPEVVDRPKMGFSFPFKEWLRGDFGAHVEEAFRGSRLFADGWVQGEFALSLLREHRAGAADHAPRIWQLYSLCRWYDRWLAP